MAKSIDPIRLPIVEPIISVVGNGFVTKELIGSFSNADFYAPDDAQRTDQLCYRFDATSSDGWHFDRYEIFIEWTNQISSGSATKTVKDSTYRSYWFEYTGGGYWYKPGEPQLWDADGRFFFASSAGSDESGVSGTYYLPWGYDTVQRHAYFTRLFRVTAIFVRESSPGIIYSPTRDGKIVFDLETDQPMFYP